MFNIYMVLYCLYPVSLSNISVDFIDWFEFDCRSMTQNERQKSSEAKTTNQRNRNKSL